MCYQYLNDFERVHFKIGIFCHMKNRNKHQIVHEPLSNHHMKLIHNSNL